MTTRQRKSNDVPGTAFRLQPHRCPSASPEAALAAIASGPSHVDDETLIEWLEHPDERVALAAIARYPKRLRGGRARTSLDARLDELDRTEPDVWSPLIDQAPGVKYRDSTERERAMQAWFRRADADDALTVLLRFPSDLPGWVAARYQKQWTPELVRAVAAASRRSHARLGANGNIQGDSAVALFDLMLDWLQDEQEGRTPYIANRLRVGLQRFCERAPAAVGNIAPKLLRVVRQGTDGHATIAARGLGSFAGYDEALGYKFLEFADGRSDVIAEFLKGGKASVAVAERALDEGGTLAVRRAIAKREEWLTSDVLRAGLAESDCARVLTALIETAATGQEADSLLYRLAQSNAHRALEAIEGHLPSGYSPSSRVMATLLSHDHRRVREQAVQMVGASRSDSVRGR